MKYNYLEEYVSQLQVRGRYSFTIEDVENHFPKQKSALHMALKRLMDKQRIARIRKGFYIVVPVEYRSKGTLPASFFINDLMNHLQKKYYVGLLSASALHGAAHQQPQVFQVVINPPQMRPVKIKGMKIIFIMKKGFPTAGKIHKKTDTGYMSVSNPEMTALDLIQYQRQCGGFARTLELLEELAENFDQSGLEQALMNQWPNVILQRFGFLCEHFLNLSDYSQPVRLKLKSRKIHPERLSPSESSRAGAIDKTWAIIRNIEIESEY